MRPSIEEIREVLEGRQQPHPPLSAEERARNLERINRLLPAKKWAPPSTANDAAAMGDRYGDRARHACVDPLGHVALCGRRSTGYEWVSDPSSRDPRPWASKPPPSDRPILGPLVKVAPGQAAVPHATATRRWRHPAVARILLASPDHEWVAFSPGLAVEARLRSVPLAAHPGERPEGQRGQPRQDSVKFTHFSID